MALKQFKAMLPYGAYEFSVPESFHLESTWEWEWEGNKVFMLRVPKNYYGYFFKEEIIAQLRLQGLKAKDCRNGCIGIMFPEGKTKCYIFWSKYFNHYFIYFYK